MAKGASGVFQTLFCVSHIAAMPAQLHSQARQPVLDSKERVRIFSSQADLKASSPYKELHWQYIGPTNISGRCTDVESVSPRAGHYIMPFAYVHDLQVHPRDNMIIVATNGRGMFVLDANPIKEKDKIRSPGW